MSTEENARLAADVAAIREERNTYARRWEAVRAENIHLQRVVAALVKWVKDPADGKVKYTDEELRIVTRLLSPAHEPAACPDCGGDAGPTKEDR